MSALASSPPLFRWLPALRGRIGWAPLLDAPSPVEPLARLEAATGGRARLLVKRDDACGAGVHGSKLRKCEAFLGEALARSARGVLTSGAADSNHVLATALHAAALGLRAACLLTPARAGPRVRRHLVALLDSGATLVHCPHRLLEPAGERLIERERARLEAAAGGPALEIPFGGGGTLGALGAVNAALELAEQVERGAPAPDVIYLPLATMGMTAGLMLGVALAGLPTRVVGVRVVERARAGEAALLDLLARLIRRLARLDPSLPPIAFGPGDVTIHHGFAGPGYGLGEAEARRAQELARADGLELEEVYTAKAMAALLDDLEVHRLDGRTVLFWNTAPGPARGPERRPAPGALPPELSAYFADPPAGSR